jgi:hypothetical protein
MTDEAQVWLITEVETIETVEPRWGERGGEDVGGGFGRGGREQVTTIVRKRVPLNPAVLKAEMSGLLQVVGDVFDQASQQRGLQLEEVELSVELTGEGQVSIMGSGGKLADKGGIKLKFKRATPGI